MTLDELQTVQKQLDQQYQVHMANPPADGKDVVKHANAIEIKGAQQLIQQLIGLEMQKTLAPPGAMGPNL